MREPALPWWTRAMSQLIAARYRAEVVADLADERDQMRRAGRSSAYGAIWMAAHVSRSAVASRRRERRASEVVGSGRPPRWPGSGAARELRHALRSLRRAPWYTATVIVVTALSMALASTVFALVDGVLFKPLPYPDPAELYAVSGRFDDGYRSERGVELVSPLEVAEWSAVASDVPLTSLNYSSFSFGDGTRVGGVFAGPGFFEVFGVRLLAGGFTDEHYATELPVRPIVISHRLWQTRFDGDPGTLGRILPPTAGQPPHQIVGILARDAFVPPLPQAGAAARRRNRIDVIRPPLRSPSGQLFPERSSLAFARIDTAALPASQAALNRAAEAYRATAPPMPEGMPAASRPFFQPYDRVELLPLRDLVSSRERPVLALAFGMAMSLVVLVLLNVGALAMARAQQRIRDLSLRRALGARARDLLRHALGEQALLFGGGAAAGLLASPMLLAFVLDRMPPGLNLIKEVRLDWRVMMFAAVVSATAALVVALLSVRVAVRQASVTPALADAHGITPGRLRIGRVLIAGQTAVAFALVLGGALFATSLVRLWSEDPGLRLGYAATFSVIYSNDQDGTTMDRWRQTNDLAGALRAAPGVRGITLLDEQLMDSITTGRGFFEPPPSAIDGAPMPTTVRVSGTFFETAGIDLVSGRLPSDAELDTGAPVIAVSETVARAYWPEGTAIGRTLRADRPSSPIECRVVGIVRDVRLEALDVPSSGVIFASWALPVRQTRSARVLVAMEDDAVLSTVIRRLGELEPGADVRNVQLLEEAAAETIRERRLAAAMGSTFGGVALVFVALGVLGLVAMTSGRRTREMAIRLALGAEPGGVTRLLVGEQLRAVGLGLVAGGVLAAWIVPLLGSRLYGIGVYDAGTWALTVAVIAATATIGALVPAWRASRIDPAAVLRGE